MEKISLKVLTYNIHKGFNTGSFNFVLNKIKRAVRTIHPDLVLLQEVLGHHEGHRRRVRGWPNQTQFEYLADELWPHFAYGRNSVYTDGHHGNAILSKYPIESWENIDISTNSMEKRGLLHGVLRVPGRRKPLHAICVHLGLLEAERIEQARRLCARIDSHVPHGEPLVIAGDFNDWRQRVSPVLGRSLDVVEVFKATTGAHAKTFPSWLPALRLDRIYVRGLGIRKAKCLAGGVWGRLSDHTALFAELVV